jgi:hypothetical protein
MTVDKRDLLEVLKDELAFLEQGGYRNPSKATWRPHLIFQDSPTCPKFEASQPQQVCSSCVLTPLVPEDLKGRKVPCRFVPLNDQGETIDSLYRSGTQQEVESTFKEWLKNTIDRLELERRESLRASLHPEIHVRAKFVTSG